MNITEKRKTERRRMRDVLPVGAGKAIAELAGVSENSVSNFFKGEGNNHKIKMIVAKMIDVIDREDAMLNAKVERIIAKM